jgi:di/tricarboxylate transporter
MRSLGKIRSIGLLGFCFGGALCAALWQLPIPGLPFEGRKCLALSLMAVVWWTTKALSPGYVSLALLVGYVLLLDREIAGAKLAFGLWTTPLPYLVLGGFFMAEAVRSSGLGKRLALRGIGRYARTYKGMIVSCYVWGFLLSFMIPHPWPRSFLLMSVMTHVVKTADLSGRWSANIGLAVFAGSIPTSMILLTGDSSLNSVTVDLAGADITWLRWLFYMGVPGVLACVLTCFTQIELFGAPEAFALDGAYTDRQLTEIGKMSPKELSCAAVLAATVLAWMTDSFHHIHPGWIMLLAVTALSSPFVGALEGKSFSCVNWESLFFLCAAMAIGSVGRATGMNAWIAELARPETLPADPYALALFVCLVCMSVHMFLGSILTVLSLATPAIVAFGNAGGLPPIASALLAYTAVALHWLLPFHSMNLLVGYGPEAGGYTEKEILKFGVYQTIVTLLICLFEITWWKLIKLI